MRKGRTPFIVAACALAITASLAAVSAPPASAANILLNPSFETASGSAPANWTQDAGTGITYTHAASGGFDGSRYVHIVNTSTTTPARIWQAVSVQPNSIYTLSVYVRTSGGAGLYGSYITGTTRDTDIHNPGEGNTYSLPNNTGGSWQQATRTLTTASETSTNIEILIGTTAGYDIDLVSLEWTAALPVDAPIVKNGSFETATGSAPADWTFNLGSTGVATYKTDGGYDGTHYEQLSLVGSGPAYMYEDIPVSSSTTYTISVRARSSAATAWFGGHDLTGTTHVAFDTTSALWKRYTATFTTGSTQTTWRFVVVLNGSTTSLDIDMVTIAPAVNVDYNTSLGTIPNYKMTATNGRWNATSSWQTEKGIDTLKTEFDQMRMNIPIALWSKSEGGSPEPDDWTTGDELADAVVNKQGAKIQPLIVGTMPKWLSSQPTNAYYFAYPPASGNNSKWANLAVQEVTRYNSSPFSYNIKYIDIWNEPNLANSWNGTMEEYFALYGAAANALRTSDSTLKLGTGFARVDPKWMQAFLDYVKANNVPLDFIGWHRYVSDPNVYDRDLALLKQYLADRSMTSVEIVLEEMNYGTNDVAGQIAGVEGSDNYMGAEQEISVMDHMATQGLSKVLRYKDKNLWAPHGGLVGDHGILFSDDSPKKQFFIHKAYNMFNEATSPTNTRISASGSYRDLDVLAGKNTTTGSTTLMFVNKTDDMLTTNLNLTNLPYTGGGWVETSYHVTWNYDWRVDSPVSHSASSSLSRTLDLPPRSTTVIRLKSGSSSESPTTSDIDMVADAHNARWETPDGQLQWDNLRGMPGQVNLLTNGGFEGGLWPTVSGSGISLDTTAGEFDKGAKSAKFVGGSSQQTMTTAAIPVTGARHYRVEARIKTTSVSPSTGFSVQVEQFNSSGTSLGYVKNDNTTPKLVATGGTQGPFRALAADVVNLDPTATNVKVSLIMDAGASGTAYVDEVKFSTYSFEQWGDFERWPDTDTDPLGIIVKTANWSPDNTTHKSGDASAKVTSTTTDQAFFMEPIAVSATSLYALTAAMQTSGVTTLTNVGVWLHQYSNAGATTEIGTATHVLTPTSASGWNSYGLTLNGTGGSDIALNSATQTVRLELRMPANAGGTAWFDDVMLVGSKGIASRQTNLKMEDGNLHTVLAMGTPWKVASTTAPATIAGQFRRIDVPESGTVTVSATGGFRYGGSTQTATFSILYKDLETGAVNFVGTATPHAYGTGALVTVGGTLPPTLAGKRISIYLHISTTGGGLLADQAGWTSATITGLP